MGYARKHGRNSSDRGWEVKTSRPEETHLSPNQYFDSQEVDKYARSSGMKNAQRNIAGRIIDLVGFHPEGTPILDLGCGTGNTSQFYQEQGYNVTGLDVNPAMLDYARAKGITALEGDMRDLESLFEPNTFQGVFSVSALQWLTEVEDLKQVARGIYGVISPGGFGAIQFYPKTEEALFATNKIFRREGLLSDIVVENQENQRKRLNFLVFKKI